MNYEAGQTVFKEGDAAEDMFYVLRGMLRVVAQTRRVDNKFIASIVAGDMVGEISIITGSKRTATIEVVQDSVLIRLPEKTILKLLERSPALVGEVTNPTRKRLHRRQLLELLPTFFSDQDENIMAAIEHELDWVYLSKGEVLFNQGDASNEIYFLISGKLRVYLTDNQGQSRVLNDIERGEIVGEMAFFTKEERFAGVRAIQNSILVKLDQTALETLIDLQLKLMMSITSRIASRLKNSQASSVKNKLNIAIVPAQKDQPMAQFVEQLKVALSKYGATSHLNRERFESLVGIESASEKLITSDPYSIRLYTWLDEQADSHHYNLFEEDVTETTWSKCCIDQADLILVVASADRDCYLEAQSQQFAKDKRMEDAVKQTLILLHDQPTTEFTGTIQWLDATNADDHHHISVGNSHDFARLARFVSGRAVGLALGGGARGCAHIGIIRALEEANIPIDMVGGTSIGSIIGAQFAIGWRYEEMLEHMQRTFLEIRPHREFTLPMIALTGGKRSDKVGQLLYGDVQIEDLPVNFFCVSASLIDTKMVVHKRGMLRTAVKASSSLPGVAPPIVIDNNLLIDGGLINNLPADIMKDTCQGHVIAVDVGSEINFNPSANLTSSPWKILSDKLLPNRESSNILTIFDVLIGATEIGDSDARENVKQISDCYLRPPVEDYSILGFDSMMEIAQCGYDYGRQKLESLDKDGLLDFLPR